MIPRYARPAMTAIWEPENRYRIWFEIEAHALDAMAELGVVPKEAARKVVGLVGDQAGDRRRRGSTRSRRR